MIRPLLGLPATETQARCKVVITPSNKGETWHRTMGESQFNSQQWAGDSLVFEQVGFSRLAFQMVVEKGKLHYQLSKLSIFGLPIPQFLWSEVRAVESMKNGYIHFDIRANGVFSHLLVKYEGLLDKVTSDGTVVWEKEGGPNES
ncbi:MAG: DUF4166 domain-containing protein [Methylococcales bacterium]|nr:DUF4166 domain-containing protein [Methylococcales bacterium]